MSEEEKPRKIPKEPFWTEEETEAERLEREETEFLDTEIPPLEEEGRVPFAEFTRPLREEVGEAKERIVGVPIRLAEKAEEWRITTPASDTVCAERDVERVRIVRGVERIVGVEVERPKCVWLPVAKRCFMQGKPYPADEEKVKALFACADETAGYLTSSQASALAEIGEDQKDIKKTKEIMDDLVSKKNLKSDPKYPNWVDGTKYYIMEPDTRKQIREEKNLTL